MALLPVVSHAASIKVDLDADQKEDAINPLIYGQFIEHMGRCIYGGIWAEMLEDRKFYFEISKDYAPYTRLEDTEFPVVGASPWEIIGNVDGLQMVRENSFVGDHTPHLKQGTGIRQHDLAWEKGRGYEGYIWLKRTGEENARVVVSLEAEGTSEEFTYTVSGEDYQKFYFNWTGDKDTEKGIFSVHVKDGAVFVGTASVMPDDNISGMRADTIALMKELQAPIYRWPGGNFVSGYDWRDGIGDRDRRPPRRNPAWQGVEHNDFGTDEFIDFCRTVGADPVVTANMGFGDAYSAAQWVEYCNAGGETIGGKWRIENGHPVPFNVKYWCVGNEMWGNWQLGYMHLDQYVLKHNRAASAMWDVDPDIVLVGSGDIRTRSTSVGSDRERGWSEGLLQDSSEYIDLISEHFYAGRTPWSEDEREPIELHVTRIAEFIKFITDEHRKLQPTVDQLDGRVIPIAMTEWNYWHRDYVYGELGCIYDLQDALGIAAGLHEYYRQSDLVQMAYYAQTVNVIGAIKTTKTEAEFASTGLVLKMYRAHYGEIPLTLEAKFAPLDVVAALDDDGKTLTIGIVNPLEEESTVVLNLKGAKLAERADVFWVAGASETDFNVPGEPRKVDEYSEEAVDVSNGLKVPALSCAIFRIPLH